MCAVRQSPKALTTDFKNVKRKALKKVLTNAMLKWLLTCSPITSLLRKSSSTHTYPRKKYLN